MHETMSSSFHEELAGLCEAVHISPDGSFDIGGIAQTGGAGNLLEQLTSAIYRRGYCNRYDVTVQADADRTDLTVELIAANASRSRSYSGWRITNVTQSGRIEAQRGSSRRSFWPGEYLTFEGQGVPARAGGPAAIYVQRESTESQPGYYIALGEALADDSESTTVRLYWNVMPICAPALLAAVTRDLNAFEVPFRYKCPVLVQGYHRRDAAVLYVSARYYEITAQLAARWAVDPRITLNPGIPLFTKWLSPGVALAEDPGNGESFGTSRCRVVAEALINARENKTLDPNEKLDAVKARFVHVGLDIDHPYLNVGSVDRYPMFGDERRDQA